MHRPARPLRRLPARRRLRSHERLRRLPGDLGGDGLFLWPDSEARAASDPLRLLEDLSVPSAVRADLAVVSGHPQVGDFTWSWTGGEVTRIMVVARDLSVQECAKLAGHTGPWRADQ